MTHLKVLCLLCVSLLLPAWPGIAAPDSKGSNRKAATARGRTESRFSGRPQKGDTTKKKPDTMQAKHRARPLNHWPNARDLARLQSVKGKTEQQVIRVLGYPSTVQTQADGTQVWDYPWLAACRVWVRKGVCVGTFYTAGY